MKTYDQIIDDGALCASEAIMYLANKHGLPPHDIMTHIVRRNERIVEQFLELIELGLKELNHV